MERKKIVFIVEALGGGVRRHIVDMLENLNKNDYEIHVIYGVRIDDVFLLKLNELKANGIKFYEVKSLEREINVKNDYKASKEVFSLLKKIKPEIVHCHSSKAGAIGRICAKLLKIKNIYYTPHAYAFMNPNISIIKKFIYLSIEKLLSFLTSKIIHVSKGEEIAALNNNVVKPHKSTVIYNGVESAGMNKKETRKNHQFVVGTVARMDHQKNPLEFIKIAELVLKQIPNVVFVYVGDGEMFNEVKEYTKKSPFENNIKLLGFHSNPIIELQHFDVFLTTSLYEGLPYSLIEAISIGIPVIATNIIGNNEVVKDSYNGFLYNSGEIEVAANIIKKLVHNDDYLSGISKNSFEQYSKFFKLDKMIMEYDSIYKAN